MISLSEAISIVTRWLPPIDEKDKEIVANCLSGTEPTLGIPLLREYLKLVRPYLEVLGFTAHNKKPREADCLASGAVFFYGCLMYILHFPDAKSHIRDILLYNILYMLVDHYIDDVRIDSYKKEQTIKQMEQLLHDPTVSLDYVDPVLSTIAQVYHELITRCPRCKKSLMMLFKAEISGLSIQNSNSKNRDSYFYIALRKGGLTMLVLHDIVQDDNPEIRQATYHLGTIMQLLDDCLDMNSDRSNGIHTIATYDKILDRLWIETVELISEIDGFFTLFKTAYSIFAVYLPDRQLLNFSHDLQQQCTKLNLFNCDAAGMLVSIIAAEIDTENI
jgi:hypothetical protein